MSAPRVWTLVLLAERPGEEAIRIEVPAYPGPLLLDQRGRLWRQTASFASRRRATYRVEPYMPVGINVPGLER